MKYDAFISYRHSDLDMYIAKKVHKGLETFKVPRAVAEKSGKKNIKRVFRDQEELPIGSDLGENIESALAESEFLLVICSPRTPESYWVQKEIDTFIEMHGRENVLAVLIEGEPDQSFPKQLLEDEEGNPVEPLAADVRGATKNEINKKMKTEIMRLAAPLLHCSYDDLRQRHRERRMKKMIGAVSAVAVLGVAFGAYSAYNTAMIQKNYEGKQINQSKYLADTALTLLKEGDRQTAALVALEALPTEENDRPYVANAQYALSKSLNCYDTGNVIGMDRALKHDLPVSEFLLNEEGTMILSIDQGDYTYVWNVDNGEMLAKISPELDESGYVISPIGGAVNGEHILICDKNGLRSVDFTGVEEWRTEENGYFTQCDIDCETGIAACVSSDDVIFYDITDGHEVGRMENGMEAAFTSPMAFSIDKQKFAVAHLVDEGTVGCVSVYDFTTKTATDFAVSEAYAMDIAFSVDDSLVVASCPRPDYEVENDNGVGFIEKIDCGQQMTLWKNEFVYQKVGVDSASAQIKCRKYTEDETGKEYDQVLMSIDNAAYNWNSGTGELVAEVRVTGGIRTFLVAVENSWGYLAESNGTINIVDMNTGMNYTSSAIETGKYLTNISIKNSVLVMQSYASPALTVMKYHEGAGKSELETYEESVDNMYYSKDETYYAVELSDIATNEKIYFYKTSDDSLVNVLSLETDSYREAAGFVDDANFVYVDSNGNVIFYDVAGGKEEKIEVFEEFVTVGCDMNEEGTLALVYGGSTFAVVDLVQQDILSSQDIEGYIYGAIISEDGKKIYCNIQEKGICKVEVETGDIAPIEVDGYKVAKGTEDQKAFAVSADGKLLAVTCTDGMLRVLNTEKMETVAEIPFASVSRRFVQFSQDGTEIMLQGDDHYFRVYNIKEQAFTHISVEQYYKIEQAIVNEESETVTLVTMLGIVILNKEDYERIAEIEDGLAYLPEQSAVFCRFSDTIYRFPYMTLDMLLEEAENQFGDTALTELERTQFNVD